MDPSAPPSSIAARETLSSGDLAELTYDSLDGNLRVRAIIDTVRSNSAGAIALFIGTTRDEFQGKIVTRLEYQAYTPLAMRTMKSILEASHTHIFSSSSSVATVTTTTSDARVIRSAIVHRLGIVPVGETSIIIAVSSPHRREAFEACEWLLEEVKLKVQVWKREWYTDGVEEGIVARDGGAAGEGHQNQPLWKANFPPTTSTASS